jgi:predicted phosphodiesterase
VLFRFGLLSDLHYWHGSPENNRFYRQSDAKLQRCINRFNQERLSFVLDLGDVIDRDWQSFDHILPLYKRFNAPVHHLAGNHDLEVAEQYKQQVSSRLGIASSYRSFVQGKWRFVLLDGHDISLFAHPKESASYQLADKALQELQQNNAPNAKPYNGALGREQLSWLQHVLEDASQKQHHVIIVCHYPVFPLDEHNLLNATEVLKAIGSFSCVKVWLSGHNHSGGYGFHQGIHFVNLQAMVETPDEGAFCIAEIFDGSINLKGFEREISRQLPIT